METGFIGIDTVALRFPLADANLADPGWARRESHRTDKGTAPARATLAVPLTGGTARLAVTELPGEWLGTVELEVPRLYAGSRGLCTAEEARAALVDLLLVLARRGVLVRCPHSESGGPCDDGCLLGRVRVVRVDVGMDFTGVRDSDAYVSLVQNTAQKGKPKIKARYTSGIQVGWAQGRYLVKVYDKNAQAPRDAPAGTLRVEATMRKPALAGCGIRWLRDIGLDSNYFRKEFRCSRASRVDPSRAGFGSALPQGSERWRALGATASRGSEVIVTHPGGGAGLPQTPPAGRHHRMRGTRCLAAEDPASPRRA